jgi:hypothetical protein
MKAYPIMYKHPTTGLIVEEQGMDLRQYYAGQALNAMSPSCDDSEEETQEIVKMCVKLADALIKELQNNP